MRWVLLIVGLVLVWAAVAPLVFSTPTREWLYETEGSVIERASVVLWILAAACLPILLRGINLAVLAGMGVCLAAAAREGDLHGGLTGLSVLKVRYYGDAAHPIWERALAGLVVVTVVACVVIVVIAVCQRAARSGWWRRTWVQLAVAVAALGVLTKVIDSAPAPIMKAGVELPLKLREMLGSVEEHLELMLPILVIVTISVYVGSGCRKGRSVRRVAGPNTAPLVPPMGAIRAPDAH